MLTVSGKLEVCDIYATMKTNTNHSSTEQHLLLYISRSKCKNFGFLSKNVGMYNKIDRDFPHRVSSSCLWSREKRSIIIVCEDEFKC